MKIIQNIDFEKFEAWDGGESTQEKIIDAGKVAEFESYIEENYPDGLTERELNDLLWFQEDFILEILGIYPEETEEEED